MFEAVSGFTTTGATVLVGLEELPDLHSVFPPADQWLGGIGIVVLAVALLPMLGVGGMQLLKAESPRPAKDVRLTPRITETAKALWVIYVTLTVLCAACYWMAGMSPFDAIAHSFSTVSTGGHSTHDLSLGYFDNVAVEIVGVVVHVPRRRELRAALLRAGAIAACRTISAILSFAPSCSS